ncbi:acyl-CoA/acyl-ACP dehydrogenase [Mycobacterium sp. CVI_P3]|uniref:Acyl-CoA/acyl-ACP dehydrogenase n=1 Tax=Mycobacterium pinniadriaticum TaxID=2994102 RepID=A0ABT3SN03_9MYCO|nr:acyl-CoA dehydrogenase family protein [Mycobacterium pinniadriaticum]MCX2934415.1 acyl-CoA/acyl-ACP dehydrogenase [Mycobacterium pinniadriaticum]MCX2940838.1 acyl-CoA/acyl-ACP dehydrogenase [Mycobacterium pinniadriaticum]
MDFGLTEEQTLLRSVASEFVQRVCPPETAKRWDEAGEYPEELFKGLVDMGWLALAFPEEWGGDGGSAEELTILAEQLGTASLDIAMCYVGTLIPALTIFRWGTEEQRAQIRDSMLRSTGRYAVAISEPDTGSDAAALRTSAVDCGDHYVVNGQKMWCTGAGLPETTLMTYVRTSRTERKHDGLTLLLIDPSSPGVELRMMPTLARHILGTYEVYLTDVKVPKSARVGEEGDAWRVMLANLELERVLMSGAYVGVAQSTLDEALGYVKQRQAFGRRIGDFQSIAHDLANLQVEIDCARLLAQRAAWMLAKGMPCSREGAMAKLKGSETYVAAARLGMQLLAGHGFSTESVMSFRWRESIVAPISGGTSQIQRNGIARSMGLKPY